MLTANVAAAEAKFSEELMNCAKMHDQRDQYKRELEALQGERGTQETQSAQESEILKN